MARHEIETVAFDWSDTSPVEAAMDELIGRGDGSGWINIGPALRDDQIEQLPPPPTLRWFSARGPSVPMATWTPPREDASVVPSTVGVSHGAGPKALGRLREAGAPLPVGWRRVQDHAKHGIVVHPRVGAPHGEVLGWLLSACWSLCPIDIDDQWLAEVHRP